MKTLREAVDRVTAGVLLVLTSPVILTAAAAVRLTSRGPAFFGHVRVGKGGKPFRCWKLRTMRQDAIDVLHEDDDLHRRYVGNGFKLPSQEDPRVTRVGRFLRHWYIDELPQLVNVLNGTMHLVGPRPVVPEELTEYGEASVELLAVRPGIVGAWTSRGRQRPGYPDRVRIELEYLRNRSALRDFVILARTVPVVLRGQEEP